MNLTPFEQKICDQFSTRDSCGYVHCCDCPYVIDLSACLCKANATEEEWEECLDQRYEQGLMARWNTHEQRKVL